MALKVRPLVLKDAASFRLCWDLVAKERRYFSWYEAPSLSKTRAFLRECLHKKSPILVAVDGERVVGWAGVFRAGLPSLSHNGDLLVMILPEHRGKSLGTKLTTGVLKQSRGKFESVLFCVFRKNKRARHLGKKMGFKPGAVEKKYVRLADGFDDLLITQKQMRG